MEGQEGQLAAAWLAMAWALGQPLKRGKITAVSSTPVMKEKSMDIRQRLRRETAPVRWPASTARAAERPRLGEALGSVRHALAPERRLAAKPVPPRLDKRLVLQRALAVAEVLVRVIRPMDVLVVHAGHPPAEGRADWAGRSLASRWPRFSWDRHAPPLWHVRSNPQKW